MIKLRYNFKVERKKKVLMDAFFWVYYGISNLFCMDKIDKKNLSF